MVQYSTLTRSHASIEFRCLVLGIFQAHVEWLLQAANPELDMPQILGMMQMAFDSEDPPIQYTHRSGPRPSYETHPMAPGNLTAAAILAQGQLSDEDDMASAGELLHPNPPLRRPFSVLDASLGRPPRVPSMQGLPDAHVIAMGGGLHSDETLQGHVLWEGELHLNTPFAVTLLVQAVTRTTQACQLCVQSCWLRARGQHSCSRASWGTRSPWPSPGTGVRGMQAGSRAFLRSQVQSKQPETGCTAVKQTSSEPRQQQVCLAMTCDRSQH